MRLSHSKISDNGRSGDRGGYRVTDPLVQSSGLNMSNAANHEQEHRNTLEPHDASFSTVLSREPWIVQIQNFVDTFYVLSKWLCRV
ncbi:hypothetical protein TNCV_4103211 [Trichonephila clavipes]|nr:hypothetical protein TNCV_4103211 [Trichonephila clavipes]